MFNQKGVFNDVKSIVSISGENGTLIKTINVPYDINSENFMTNDGLYAIDMGDGWIRGLDEDIIIHQAGTTGPAQIVLSREVEDSSKVVTEIQTSVGFDIGFINAAFETAFEISSAVKNTINTRYTYDLQKDKNGYGVIYKYYWREDLVRVKDNKIIDRAIRYRFSGVTPLFLEYPIDEYSNFEEQKFKTEKCLLEEKNELIKVLDTDKIVQNIGLIADDIIHSVKSDNNGSKEVYIYFSVAASGIYRIQSENGESFELYTSDFEDRSKLNLTNGYSGKGYRYNLGYKYLKSNTLYVIKILNSNNTQMSFTRMKNKLDFDISFLDNVPIYRLDDNELSFIDPIKIKFIAGEDKPVGCILRDSNNFFNSNGIEFSNVNPDLNIEVYRIELDDKNGCISKMIKYDTLNINNGFYQMRINDNGYFFILMSPQSKDLVDCEIKMKLI